MTLERNFVWILVGFYLSRSLSLSLIVGKTQGTAQLGRVHLLLLKNITLLIDMSTKLLLSMKKQLIGKKVILAHNILLTSKKRLTYLTKNFLSLYLKLT
jgi:hypothetical protein